MRHNLLSEHLLTRKKKNSFYLWKRIGLIKKTAAVADTLVDKRHQSYTKHSLLNLLKQRVFAIALGYEDLNDHNDLRFDSAFKVACERGDGGALASAPTLHRFEHSLSRADQFSIHRVIVEKFFSNETEPLDESRDGSLEICV
jgi:hypothetical protein